MSLWRFWWLTILTPALLAGVFDYVRHRIAPGLFYSWPDPVNFIAVVLLSAFVLTFVVTAYVQRQARFMHAAGDFAGLWQTAEGAAGSQEPAMVAQRVLPRIISWLALDVGAVFLPEGDRDLLVASHGLSADEASHLLQSFSAPAAREDEFVWRKGVAGFHRSAFIPLCFETGRPGFLLLATRSKSSTQMGGREVLALLGQQLALLLENARLIQQTRHLVALEERDRLSREIHDGLAQDLGYLNAKMESLKSMRLAPALQEEMKEMLEVVRGAYMDTREWVTGLRDSCPKEMSLAAFLKRTLENFTRRTGICASIEIQDDTLSFSPEVEGQLIRVVQEALANVRKHSRASAVRLVVECQDALARVAVEDNGIGFLVNEALQEGHFGLLTMRERVEGVGGILTINSYPGMGSRIEALLSTQG
ncbi:MAG: sensor histidine kinase, partial [Chloroflexi bacterium]|nr:sensor histidine kinase [Chloroflexota bacterium]